MKASLSILLISVSTLAAQAQIKFENGYVINNAGERTECLIRNMDWANNPSSFDYKIGENTETLAGSLENVAEFGIANESTYRRFKVDIDRSSDLTNRLGTNRNPEFKQETLFLRVLVVGNGTLYQYKEGNLLRFFYSVDESAVKQLVFKVYLLSNEKSARNDAYKQQLWNEMKCEALSQKDAENLEYTQGDLVKYFVKYNTCTGSGEITVTQPQRRDVYHLSVRPGIAYYSVSTTYVSGGNTLTADLESKPSFRIGLELECVLSFNRNKWAFVVEPTYLSYSGEKVVSRVVGLATFTDTLKVDSKLIEMPVGMRHYFFMKDNSRLFVNAGIIIEGGPAGVRFGSLAIGAGYNKGRFSGELRYCFERGDDPIYGGPQLVLGFRLF